ncbi:MAG: hypothetical protein HN456_00985 [Rhodobacteraceae bacterium]|nr:hypothetical protein [Paracoccaceae bacterium]
MVLNVDCTNRLLKGWHKADSKTMRSAHDKECGPFGTVLGPNADRHH